MGSKRKQIISTSLGALSSIQNVLVPKLGSATGSFGNESHLHSNINGGFMTSSPFSGAGEGGGVSVISATGEKIGNVLATVFSDAKKEPSISACSSMSGAARTSSFFFCSTLEEGPTVVAGSANSTAFANSNINENEKVSRDYANTNNFRENYNAHNLTTASGGAGDNNNNNNNSNISFDSSTYSNDTLKSPFKISLSVRATMDLTEDSPNFQKLLHTLQACREVGIDWSTILDPTDCSSSGKRVTELLQRFPEYMAESVAKNIKSTSQLGIISHIKEGYRADIVTYLRQRILAVLLAEDALGTGAAVMETSGGSDNFSLPFSSLLGGGVATAGSRAFGMFSSYHSADGHEINDVVGVSAAAGSLPRLNGITPPASMNGVAGGSFENGLENFHTAISMLASMASRNLISLKDLVDILESALKEKNKVKTAVDIFGFLVEHFFGNEGFQKATTNLQPLLQSIARDPQYDYANTFISRNLGWNLPGPQLRLVRNFAPYHSKIIISSAYFSTTDELVTGGKEGNIAVWGAPSYSEAPSARFHLGPAFIPVSMEALTRGRILAVAGVAPAPAIPIIKLYQCLDINEKSSIEWKLIDTIEREESIVITCLKRLDYKTNLFCIGESDGQSFDLTLFSGTGKLQRRIEGAHKDYITALAANNAGGGASSPSVTLLSGSRDTTVKLWDSRQATASATGAAGIGSGASMVTSVAGTSMAIPAQVLANSHTDTISAISTSNDHIVTSGLDRKVCLWDIRRLKKPILEKVFSAPVLKSVIAGVSRPCIAVSTPHGLSLLSLSNLVIEDYLSNVVYTDLRTNHDGSIVFACGNGVKMYTVDL